MTTKTEFDTLQAHLQSQQKETDRYNETQRAKDILKTQGQIAHVWSWEDVIHRAFEKKELLLTREQAEEVLTNIERHIDCELGITWITLDCWIDELK